MLFLVIVLTNCLIGISYHNTVMGKIQSYYYNQTVPGIAATDFIQSIPRFDNYSIVVVVLGVCVFELFRRLRLPELKVLNAIARGTFMIYLLHDNGFAYSIWETQDWITLLYYDFSAFVTKLLSWTFAVFAIGYVAYLVFLVLIKLISKTKWLYIKSEA